MPATSFSASTANASIFAWRFPPSPVSTSRDTVPLSLATAKATYPLVAERQPQSAIDQSVKARRLTEFYYESFRLSDPQYHSVGGEGSLASLRIPISADFQFVDEIPSTPPHPLHRRTGLDSLDSYSLHTLYKSNPTSASHSPPSPPPPPARGPCSCRYSLASSLQTRCVIRVCRP